MKWTQRTDRTLHPYSYMRLKLSINEPLKLYYYYSGQKWELQLGKSKRSRPIGWEITLRHSRFINIFSTGRTVNRVVIFTPNWGRIKSITFSQTKAKGKVYYCVYDVQNRLYSYILQSVGDYWDNMRTSETCAPRWPCFPRKSLEKEEKCVVLFQLQMLWASFRSLVWFLRTCQPWLMLLTLQNTHHTNLL